MSTTMTRTAKTNALKTEKPRRLNLESLEDRRMMIATHLVMDFTPDYRDGTFYQTFVNSIYTDRTQPAFLDFNGDRRITPADAQIAAGQIMSAVGSYYSAAARGYNVNLVYGDATGQSYYGRNLLNQGLRSTNDQVLVMYIGGRNTGEIGRAPRAPDGYNIEGYGQTYSQEIAHMLMRRSGTTSGQFVSAVANTVAHEFGHMLGLRHSLNVYSDDIMNARQSTNPRSDVFSRVNQYTDGGPVQNAFSELRNSFAGQRTTSANYNGGAAQLPADVALNHTEADHHADHDEEGHDHDAGKSCDFDLNAFLDSIASQAAETVHAAQPIASDAALETVLAKSVTLPAASQNDMLSSSLRTQPAATSQRASAGDLLTLLATDLQAKSQKSTATTPVSKAAGSVNQLDDLFTDLGFVQAE